MLACMYVCLCARYLLHTILVNRNQTLQEKLFPAAEIESLLCTYLSAKNLLKGVGKKRTVVIDRVVQTTLFPKDGILESEV